MARELIRGLLILFLMVPAGASHGQDEVLRRIYTDLEGNIRADYEALLVRMVVPGVPLVRDEKDKEALKLISYNKAVAFASCMVESEQVRSPAARRVPASENIVLRTCIEIKFAEMDKLDNRLAYAKRFFPDRLDRCEAAARLPSLERQLPPYRFLEIAEPKVYDFARYNQCLMTP